MGHLHTYAYLMTRHSQNLRPLVSSFATICLMVLTRLPESSYLEFWVDGGPLLIVRTVKIVATTFILGLATLGLGFFSTTNKQIVWDKPSFAAIVAVLGSGFSLLVIVGSFVSLIPNFGRSILTLVLFICAIVGSSVTANLQMKFLLWKNSGSVTRAKSELVLTVLILVTLLSIFIQKGVALETYSDAVQIYLPFFEYFQTFGSSSAILEKPAFSSFIQARGLGTHLAATAIGGWTSAQIGSFLSVVLIATVVFWGITDHLKRISKTRNLKLPWLLAGSASFATLLFYSSAELYSKTHIVTFALLTVLTISLPIAIDKSNLESHHFKKTATLASISICILYPLNFVAVLLIAFLSVILFGLYRKPFLVSRVIKNVSWAAGSALFVFATNLYFVGVLSTEPFLRSIKVDHIFHKFSSEGIWIALYGSQGLGGLSTFIKEPFVSQGIFSKDSIITLLYLFDARGYLFFVLGAIGLVVLIWDRLNAALLSLSSGLFVFVFVGFVIFKNVSDVSRVVALLLGTSGVIVVTLKIVVIDVQELKSLGKPIFLLPFSPFLLLIFVFCTFSVAYRVFNQPSFERLALQGTLGILLLPVLLAFVFVQVESPNTYRNLNSETRRIKIRALATLKKSCSVFAIAVIFVSVMTLFQLVFPQRRLIFLSLTIFNLVVLSLVVLRVWQNAQDSNRSFHARIRDLSTSWTIVLLLTAVVGILPTYPRPTDWSVVDWSKEIASVFQGLIGSDGFMPMSSDVLGFHTKRDILRCFEVASMLPKGAKIFPVNGLFEFAACQGTPGLNRGQLIHHYDSILAPRFDDISSSDPQQTITIFQEMNINYLVLLKGDCRKFLVSQNDAFDANNLSHFRVFGKGSDFVVLDVRFPNQINQTSVGDFLHEYLVEYSRSCEPEPIQ